MPGQRTAQVLTSDGIRVFADTLEIDVVAETGLLSGADVMVVREDLVLERGTRVAFDRAGGVARWHGPGTARALAESGAAVTLAVRDVAKGEGVAESIRASTGNDRIDLVQVELSSPESVRACAKRWLEEHGELHLLRFRQSEAQGRGRIEGIGEVLSQTPDQHRLGQGADAGSQEKKRLIVFVQYGDPVPVVPPDGHGVIVEAILPGSMQDLAVDRRGLPGVSALAAL